MESECAKVCENVQGCAVMHGSDAWKWRMAVMASPPPPPPPPSPDITHSSSHTPHTVSYTHLTLPTILRV